MFISPSPFLPPLPNAHTHLPLKFMVFISLIVKYFGFFVCLRQVTLQPRLTWKTQGSPGWPETHASAFLALECLKTSL